MSIENEIREIFEGVTEHYEEPLRLSSRCETNVYYRVEDLSQDDLQLCAEYIAERIMNVGQKPYPDLLINLKGSYTNLADLLSRELGTAEEPLEVIQLEQLEGGNGIGNRLKQARVVLVNDVITTARTCLKAHSQITMMGASILCWAALIDRTFGPGPVPIAAAFTGAPITLLEELP